MADQAVPHATTVFEYVTTPSGVIHLMRQDISWRRNPSTLCGFLPGWWVPGDETMSGVAATCGRCRQIVHIDHLPNPKDDS